MGSGHAHGESGGAKNQRRLTVMLVLVAGYMVAEIIGGLLANSLALLADAGHMFSDVVALALSLFALWFARRPPSPRHTYGYYRTEILAALINGAILIAVSLYIFVEAIQRFGEPPEVQGPLMMAIAIGGLAINLVGLWLLKEGYSENLNVRAAWLSVMADTLGSVGVLIGGGLIWAFGWNWADPAVSMIIGALIIYSAWILLRSTVAVLMESAPENLDIDEVRNAMAAVPGVKAVSDLHVWTITSGIDALSGRVEYQDGRPRSAMLKELHDTLHDRFGIEHVTVQIEPTDFETREPTI